MSYETSSDAHDRLTHVFRWVERITAVGAAIGGLEVVRVGSTYADDSINSWPITRTRLRGLNRGMGQVVDHAVRHPRVLTVAGVRAASAALLTVPGLGRRTRAVGLVGAVGSGALLHLRTNYGNDGSDHMAVLNFTTALVDKAFPYDLRARQMALGFVAAQSALSYFTSGVVKLGSPMWRSGEALTGILRTGTYGDQHLYAVFRDRPRLSMVASWAVMLFESGFPLVFVLPKPLSRSLLLGAAAFHLVNARFMGLNRFLWSFVGSYPAVAYFADQTFVNPAGVSGGVKRQRVAAWLALALAGAAMAWTSARWSGRGEGTKSDSVRGSEASPGPGQQLSVSSGRVHAVIAGAEHGTPVLFESALATPCTAWAHVVSDLGDDYRTICYDRPGNGWTVPVPQREMTATETVGRALEVLQSSSKGPAIVVGHSVGGLLALMAAARAPHLVCGLVLVDASHPGQLKRSNAQRDGVPMVAQGLRAMLRPRRRRTIPAEDFGAIMHLTPEIRDLTVERLRHAAPWRGALAELRAWRRNWSDEADKARLPSDLPLAVVTAGEQANIDPVHGQLQAEFATLSSPARHTRVVGASHDGLVLTDTHAGSVADAIRWVREQGRSRQVVPR